MPRAALRKEAVRYAATSPATTPGNRSSPPMRRGWRGLTRASVI